MNLFTMTGQQAWELLGWTMCYFLAAGSVVALAGALLRLFCKRAAPQIRYSVSLAVFATLAVLPFGIAIGLSPPMPIAKVPNPIVIDLADTPTLLPLLQEPIELTNLSVVETPTAGADAVSLVVAIARQNDGVLERALEFLPWLWLIGTPVTFLLLATGLIGSNRFRQQCTRLTEGPIFETCERLRTTLTVSRRVGIAIHERIAAPILIGILRPLILLPPAALTGWSPEQLEMVLLHELAHVRRWDNLVNLVQRLVESLLFFHPAVWLVSRQVRLDREQCCDAVVVAHTAKPQAYAELLVNIAASPSPLAGLALARHPLAGRIRRILKLEDEPMLVSRRTLGAFIIAATALVAVILWQPAKTSIAEEPNAAVSNSKEKETVKLEETSSEEPSRHFEADAPQEEIDEFVGELKAAGLTLFIEKHPAGAITIRGTKTVPPTPASPPLPFFLSLGQQRMADLAYKALGIELEPLKPEEDAQITAKVFKGGLRVTSYLPASNIRTGDILIGLHAWPTQSLEDVAEILQRDDIAELSPLKYYVLRPGNVDGSWSSNPSENLVTGRIEVNKTPTVFDSLKKEKKTEVQLPAKPTHICPMLCTPPQAGPGKCPVCEMSLVLVDSAGHNQGDLAIQNPAASTLLYDGKNFGAWREMWKTELKVEKRTEAIQALAAFGRAGYGKEAAEAIFDVAEQYDFRLLDSVTPEGKLKEAVIKVLTTTNVSHFSEKIWLPVLLERIEDKPSQRNMLAYWLLRRIRTTDQTTLKQLDALTRHADLNVRQGALRGMCNADPNRKAPLILEALRRALASDDFGDVMNALGMMHSSDSWGGGGGGGNMIKANLRYMPELVPVLFHKNESVRQMAQRTLASIQPGDAPKVVEQLVSILHDQKQSVKHLTAIRALAGIGKQAATAEPVLEKMIQHEDINRALAAVHAVNSIRGMPDEFYNPATKASLAFLQRFAKQLGVENITQERPSEEGLQLIEKYQKLYEQEREMVFLDRSVGGGGFF